MVSEGARVLLGDVTTGGGVAWTPLYSTPTQDELTPSLTTAQVCIYLYALCHASPCCCDALPLWFALVHSRTAATQVCAQCVMQSLP